MRKTETLDAAYFEGLFQGDPDPWKFETSAYERDKYAASLAVLGSERAAHALEVGCANGVFTRALARVCDALLAIDVSATALSHARARCRDLRNVTFRRAGIPMDPVAGRFDLMVLSEVAYYWDQADSNRAAAALLSQHQAGGRLLLVHWLGETDYPVSGDDAVARLAKAFGTAIRCEHAARTDRYRLDLWRWTI